MNGSLTPAQYRRVFLVHSGHESGRHRDDPPSANPYEERALSSKFLLVSKTKFYYYFNLPYQVHQLVARPSNHVVSDPMTLMLGVT